MSHSENKDDKYKRVIHVTGILLVEKSEVQKLRADIEELPPNYQSKARETLKLYEKGFTPSQDETDAFISHLDQGIAKKAEDWIKVPWDLQATIDRLCAASTDEKR
ncbi:hypothetical protein HD806DRAFT_532268 [Xylariaceae sp. AK1471]|nr:hypothetical protein HD806DRAFT_532268 [Xylariaceae sp. AK1471]